MSERKKKSADGTIKITKEKKKLCESEGERNENRVYLIKLVLDRMKKIVRKVYKKRKFILEENEKILDIVDVFFSLIS